MKKIILLLSVSLFFISSISEASIKKERSYIVSDKPWLTNEPYLKDAYSIKSAEENKRLTELAKQEISKKCKSIDFNCAGEIKRKYQKKNKYPARGTLEYVIKEYVPMKSTLLGNSRKLKRILENLHQLRKKTRSLGLGFEKKEFGELTYEDVRNEICLIEENVGYLSRKRYCNAI